MPFKPPKNTEFSPVGEVRSIVMKSLANDAETKVTVEYGNIVTIKPDEGESAVEPGVVKGSRYVLSFEMDIMGVKTDVSAGAVDMAKATQALVVAFNQDPDAFEFVWDEEDEFFSQKYTAPKVDKSSVWENPKYKDDLPELRELRAGVEQTLAAAQDKDIDSQATRLDLAKQLKSVCDTFFGGDRKATSAWLRGEGKDGENMPLVTQLGKGKNAITEAMKLAELSDLEYAMLPASVTSGKGVDHFGRSAIKEIVSLANMNKLMKLDTTDERPSINGCELMLRHIAEQAFGIEAATAVEGDDYLVSLPELVSDVEDATTKAARDISTKYGKSVNTYDKAERTESLVGYGCVRVSKGGQGLFAHAVDQVEAYYELVDGDAANDENVEKIMARLFSKTGGNALMKEAYADAKSHQAAVAGDKARSAAVVAATQDNTKVDSKKWEDLEPLAAAARLYDRLIAHKKTDEVSKHLRALMSQSPTVAAAEPVAAE